MTGLPDNNGNDFIRGLETRACVNGMTKSDVERLKNALVKKILDDETVIDVTEDGSIVADSNGMFLSVNGQVLGLSVDGEDVIPVTEPYLPEDENENPLAPPNDTIMTSANIAVDPRIVHSTGNEIITGIKTFSGLIKGRFNKTMTSGGSGYTLLFKRTGNRIQWLKGFGGRTYITINVRDNSISSFVLSDNQRPYPQPIFLYCIDSKGNTTVWMKNSYASAFSWFIESNSLYGIEYTDGIELDGTTYQISGINVNDVTPYDSDATFTTVINSVDFATIR